MPGGYFRGCLEWGRRFHRYKSPDFTEYLRAWVPRPANRGRYLASGGEQSLKIVLAVFQEDVILSERRSATVDTYERGGLKGRPFFMP